MVDMGSKATRAPQELPEAPKSSPREGALAMSIRSKRSKGGDGSAEKGTKLQPARTNYCLELNLLKHHRDATHAADTGLRVLSAEEEASGICSVLRAMYAASPDGILVVTAQGTVLSYNRKLAEIWRMPLEHTEVCEWSLLAITNGAILTMASDRVKTPRAFADRVKDLYAHPDQEDHCEIELRDGRTLERHSSPLRTQQGKYLGRVWFYRDITERKRYEQELLRSERDARERLAEIEQIYQHSPVGLGLLDSAYRHVRINDRLAAMAGMKANECVGKTVRQFVPELADKIIAASRPVFEQGKSIQDLELCAHAPGGHGKAYGLANYAPFRDANGEITGLIVSVLDITQRKLAEQSVRRLVAEFETLFNCANDAIFIVRLSDRRIVEVNATACSRYGYSKEELLSMPIDEIESIDGEAIARARHAQIAREGECRFTSEHRRKDGSLVPVEVNIRKCEFRGETVGLAIIRDITERKEVEVAMIRAREAAEDAARIKSQFLANMSHEIRTPLNGVIGMTGLILDTDLTPEQRRYAEIIHDSGENLIAVINGILDYSKLEAKKLMLEKRSFDLGKCLRQAIDILAAKAHEKGLELTCHVSPDTPLALWGDAGRLHQVLVNLVGNAVKFTPCGSVQVTVGVEHADDDSAILRFTVSDSGVGMPGNQIAGLFDPFVQADASTTRRFGGTGLGLTIARELVELMGGRIGAQSEVGKGSIFWFTTKFARQRWSVSESQAWRALEGVRVLIADSRAESRDSIRAILDSWKCCSAEAADAATALELLGEAARAGRPFQAALVDIALPGTDASELTRQIAGDPLLCATPLVAIIRLGVRSELARAQAAAFAGQLTRPIWNSSLGEALTLVLAGAAAAPACNGSPKRPAAARLHLHVLLVEDNPINQEVATTILRSLGCSADLAENGREAVQAVRRNEYDLILMDCEMHEMDGYVATRQIRAYENSASRRPLPIIAMTAHALDGDREKCLAAGMNDYISKPVDPTGLAEILARWQAYGRQTTAAEPAGARAANLDSVFDEGQFLNRVMGDEGLAATLVHGFVEQFPEMLARLTSLLDARDFGGVRLHAHSLKGAAATLSAADLAKAAAELEAAAATEDLQAVVAAFPHLEKNFNQLKQALGQTHWAAASRKETEDEKSYC